MKIQSTDLDGCFIIEPFYLEDHRGSFCKPFHSDEFKKHNLNFEIKEQFYSKSKKNILRGLHFQLPPKATKKLVTCISGRVLDCVVDLRKKSPTYLKSFTIELNDPSKILFIPEGFAHGFCSLEDDSTLLYMNSEVFYPEFDSGIKWNSLGINWPVKAPIISERDEKLVPFKDFNNPF